MLNKTINYLSAGINKVALKNDNSRKEKVAFWYLPQVPTDLNKK
ncbi:hypothetical protein [Paenibacillus elgii]|nr:hypothetical protein [Paenibacillus elgii]